MHPTIARRVVYPLLQWKGGGRVLSLLDDLERSERRSPEFLRELQEVKLRALLHHAYRHVPYYQELFKARGLLPRDVNSVEEYGRLPALAKETVRDRRRDLLADNLQGRLMERQTSGSTGVPLAVSVYPATRDAWLAASLRVRRWWGLEIGTPQISLVNPHRKAAGTLFKQSVLMNHAEYSVFHLESTALERLYRHLRRSRYEVLGGYPSALVRFAQHVAERGAAGTLPLRAVLTTAEMLHPDQRALLQSALGCPVINSYGSAECDHMAGECPEGQMHVASENVLIEYAPLSNADREVPAAELLITDLNNYAMPLLRYRIGDLGSPGQPCPCGRTLPVLTLRGGRTEDLVILPDGRTVDGAVFAAAVDELIACGVRVRQFRAIQHAPDNIEVLIATADDAPGPLQGLEERLQTMLGARLHIVIRPVDVIPPEPSGKLRRFVSLLSAPTEEAAPAPAGAAS